MPDIPATHGRPVYRNVEECIRVDDVDALEDMVRNGASINQVDEVHKFTCLHWASFHGALQCMHWLLWHGADNTACTHKGWSPVHIAAIRGQDACIQALINNNASVNARDVRGSTPAHLAATHGKSFTLQHILRAGVEVEAQDSNGWTATHCAAFHGRLGCLQLLVKWGARLDDTDRAGNTAAHLAAMEGHVHCLKYIIGTSSNPSVVLTARNDDGETIRTLAERFYKDNIIEYANTIEYETQNPEPQENHTFPAHVAAYKGDLAELKALVENGVVNINERDEHGSTPAHKAAGQGHIAVLRWLIETGCDLGIRNEAGETPKDVARRFAQLGALRLMGDRGDVGSEDEEADGIEPVRQSTESGGANDGESGSGVKLGAEDKKRAKARAKKKIDDLARLLDIARKNYIQLGGTLKDEAPKEVVEVKKVQDDIDEEQEKQKHAEQEEESFEVRGADGQVISQKQALQKLVAEYQEKLEHERQRRERLESQLDAYRREVAKLRQQREHLREDMQNMSTELETMKQRKKPSAKSAKYQQAGLRVLSSVDDMGLPRSDAIV